MNWKSASYTSAERAFLEVMHPNNLVIGASVELLRTCSGNQLTEFFDAAQTSKCVPTFLSILHESAIPLPAETVSASLDFFRRSGIQPRQEHLPDAVMSELRRHFPDSLTHEEWGDPDDFWLAFSHLVDELGCLGRRLAVLRGPVLEAAYPSGLCRFYGDIDFLVDVTDFPAIDEKLSSLGFAQLMNDESGPVGAMVPRNPHQIRAHAFFWGGYDDYTGSWPGIKGKVVFEPYFRINSLTEPYRCDVAQAIRSGVQFSYKGGTCTTLHPVDQFIWLCVDIFRDESELRMVAKRVDGGLTKLLDAAFFGRRCLSKSAWSILERRVIEYSALVPVEYVLQVVDEVFPNALPLKSLGLPKEEFELNQNAIRSSWPFGSEEIVGKWPKRYSRRLFDPHRHEFLTSWDQSQLERALML